MALDEVPHAAEVDPATTYLQVLDFWFKGDFQTLYHTKWFPAEGSQTQASTDRAVQTQFESLLLKAEGGLLEDWCESPQPAVALVILLDQFSRHYYRGRDDRDSRVGACDERALRYARALQDKDWEHHMTVPQRVFTLMPFRHSPTPDRLQFVLDTAKKLVAGHEDIGTLLDKFQRATLKRLQHLQGQQYVDGAEILEFFPFEADETDLSQHPLYRAMERFLQRKALQPGAVLCVSLSGGVDSMVIAKLLCAIRDGGKLGAFEVLALHIDYNNRPESGAEAEFVERWCEERRIRFRARVVTECKRGVTARDVYEKQSREIRYGFYREAMERDGVRGVFFGHHQGDLQENVISNLMKRCQLLDIAGMGEEGVSEDVPVWRPLLPHTKDEIFQFAHKFGVPYFKDTTPAWSTRGHMRNQLMPLLKEMYGVGYLQNLSTLAEHSQQVSVLVHDRILQPFWDAIRIGGLAVWFDCRAYMDMPIVFWREGLKHVCHDLLGIGLISEDPIRDQLMMRLRLALAPDGNGKSGFVELKKGHRFYLHGTTLAFLRAGFFPKTPYYTPGEEVTAATPEVQRGPYHIRLDVVRDVDEAALSAKLDLLDLLKGQFTYYLPHGPTLVIDKDKEVRPKVMRQIPKVLTDVMPIVGVRPKSGIPEPATHVKVTVTVDLR
mmetsp:Transcript_86253/g.143508  ORF Transcript_86253/g.143508 Transcript_86253/m.143508 type:complete len:664 (-) Transcript_86253:911-2902(-)